ncbi:MAG: hypothetical protein IKP65_07590 [Alphaproteobacteria bacterium]|nr:hypothetical protein [Alphaproteobacteria bacterium]
MKIRQSYVSNSSSSSFVVFNWFDLSEDKRDYIKNYDVNALALWRKKKIKYDIEPELSGFIKDFPMNGEEYSYNHDNNKEKYDFGWINNSCRWYFDENKKRNVCVIECSMDNFDMKRWLQYNKVDFIETGIKYE